MVPQDQLRVISSILLSVPLCLILRYLPSPFGKYYSLVAGILIQFYVYRSQIWIAISMHCLVYGLIVVNGRKCGFLVTAVSMALLSVYHIYRLITDYGSWTLDVSTILMGNVCKYSLFAYSYQDGAEDDEKLKTEDQRRQKIKELPSFTDYLSYCVFLPISVVSTPITYYKYSLYIHKQDCFDSIPLVQSLLKVVKDLTLALTCACVYFFGLLYFPTARLSEPGFTDHNILYVLGYAQISIYLIQWKYFFAFKLCMLPIHSSGISYNPSLDDKFNGIQSINLWEYNTTLSLPNKINSWNIPVQEWLRKGVYERLSIGKEKAKLVTFFVSAFWHGFYGGYYFAFLLFFMQMYLSNVVFKITKDSSHLLVKIYNKFAPFSRYLILVVITLSFTHGAIYFVVLSSTKCLDILGKLYFLPYITVLILILVAHLQLAKIQSTQKLKER